MRTSCKLFEHSVERIISIEGFVESGTCNRKIDRNRELDVPKAATIVVKLENMRLVFVSRSTMAPGPASVRANRNG
jgi:hypothetical protein